MRTGRPELNLGQIAPFCCKHRIRRPALLGSVLRADLGPSSDVDVPVEFEPGARIGWDFTVVQDELAELFGRPVDVLTPGSIRPAYHNEILSTAEDVYVAADGPVLYAGSRTHVRAVTKSSHRLVTRRNTP